jgi:hypothetical protein
VTVTAGLDQITGTYQQQQPNLQVAAAAGIEVVLGKLADHLDWSRKRAIRAAQAASMFPFPAQAYTVSAGGLLVPTYIAEANAPRDGYVWFATRLSVDGLVPGTGTQQYQSAAVAAPAASATVVQITAGNLAAGNYLVYVTLGLSGTLAAAADSNNMQISGPGTGGNHIFTFPGQAGEYTAGPIPLNVPAGNGTALKITAVGAATAGSVYAASLDLVPQPADQVQLYRGPGLAIAAQPQNRIHTFTAGGSQGPGPDWSPGGPGLLMNHQDTLVLAGTGLSATQLVLSGDVVQLEVEFAAHYVGKV